MVSNAGPGAQDVLLGSLDEYRNQVEALTRKRGVLLPYSRRQAALVQRLAASVREAGAEPVFLMPPSFRPALFFADSDRYRVLRYHDPARFPELFELEHRFDLKHLNREGAEIYTRMLARDLVSGSEG